MPQFPIDVRVDPTAAAAGSRRIRSELRGVETAGRRTSASLLNLFGGAAIGVGIGRAINLLADFSQEMSTVGAVSRATGAEFSQLQATAERLGRSTRFSATQAAEGMTFLARAGFDANEILATVEGTLQLAQAGGLGLGQAADIASNALQGFGLEVAETGRVVDVLALAANTSNTSVGQLGNALSFAAPIASGLGVSIEETTAAIGALSNAGLQGSRAGTGLNRVLAELESPTATTRDILDDLGVSVDDVRISSVGLSSALSVLEQSGITTGQALQAFGQRGGPSFDILANAIPDVVEMSSALEGAAGTAERVADAMDDNLNGALLAARSALQGLVIEVGNAGVTDGLTDTFNGAAGALRLVANNLDLVGVALVAYGVQVAFISASQSTLVGTTIASSRAFLAKTAQLRLTTVAMIAANGAARTLGAGLLAFAAANPVLLGVAAITTAFFLLRQEVEEIPDNLGMAQTALNQYSVASSRIENDQALLTRRVREYTEAYADLTVAARDTASTEIEAIRTRISGNQDLLQSYRDVLAAQIEQQELNGRSTNDLAEAAGISQLQDTGRRTESRINNQFGELGNLRIFEDRSDADILSEFNAELGGLRLLIDTNEELTQQERDRFALLSRLNAENLEQNDQLLRQREALRRIDEGLNPVESPSAEVGDGGGSNATPSTTDFGTAFAELQGLTAAIGENEAALERAQGVIQFARDNELELTAAQRQRVDAELRLQQVANDNQAQTQRIADIQQETELLSLSGREAEIRNAIYQAERDSILGLTDVQGARIMALLEEQQAIEDTAIINDRLATLAQEAELLTRLGTDGQVFNEVLRLQNQLERDLTDTEVGLIQNATELNNELARRRQILDAARNPAMEAIEAQRVINDLYRDGSITLAEYNRLLSQNGVANDVVSLDAALNANGGNIGASAFEGNRQGAEQLLRQQEGGGVDDGSGQTLLGLSANDLGVGGESERIREQTQERLELIRQAREQELLTEEEFADRKTAILQQSIDDQRNAILSGLNNQLSNAENLFGSLTDIARSSAGEQSGIYRGLFATQQAFAIAQSIVSIQQGLSAELAKGFPAAIPGLIAIGAQGAGIISSIQSVRANFRDGGIPMPGPGLLGGTGGGREDSNIIRVSRGEGILNAEATRRNLGVFNALNQNPDFLNNLGVFRDGGVPIPARAASAIPANNNSSGGRSLQVDVGGVSIQMPEGSTPEQARQLGREAGEEIVRAILEAETNQPGGIVFERLANG